MREIRVLLADDQDLVREGLRTILGRFVDITVVARPVRADQVEVARDSAPTVTRAERG